MRIQAVLLVVLAAGLAACGDEPQRPRKPQMVKLLPDTPPPPPPPPKPEDRPPPKPEDKPQPQDVPKPVEAPAAAALKSDEAAGDGPGNGLTAGAVTREYAGEKPGAGTTIGGGAPPENPAARLAAQTYAHAATRALHEFLARDRDVKQRDYQVRVDLWLTPAGALQRAELVGSSGDADTDRALRAALDRFPGAAAPLPARMVLPMRLLVTNRMMG
ncbi:MAG: TonB C-terminal domain-containing protein [Aquabacterium sp.]|nr:TonB C-terminal domain-containing protein [Aquabacterium sp.]